MVPAGNPQPAEYGRVRAGEHLVERSDGKCGRASRDDGEAKERVADIYERYAPSIAAYALRRSSTSDAADVTAETFLVAWRRRDVVPEEPNTLPWLYGVARRVLANQRRTHRRRGRLRDRLEAEFVRHEVDQPPLEEIEEFRRVARALQELSEDDAELLRLVTWEGLTPTEIATMLGIVPGTARQRVSRARQRLRKQLAADDSDSARPGRRRAEPGLRPAPADHAGSGTGQSGTGDFMASGRRGGSR